MRSKSRTQILEDIELNVGELIREFEKEYGDDSVAPLIEVLTKELIRVVDKDNCEISNSKKDIATKQDIAELVEFFYDKI